MYPGFSTAIAACDASGHWAAAMRIWATMRCRRRWALGFFSLSTLYRAFGTSWARSGFRMFHRFGRMVRDYDREVGKQPQALKSCRSSGEAVVVLVARLVSAACSGGATSGSSTHRRQCRHCSYHNLWPPAFIDSAGDVLFSSLSWLASFLRCSLSSSSLVVVSLSLW